MRCRYSYKVQLDGNGWKVTRYFRFHLLQRLFAMPESLGYYKLPPELKQCSSYTWSRMCGGRFETSEIAIQRLRESILSDGVELAKTLRIQRTPIIRVPPWPSRS